MTHPAMPPCELRRRAWEAAYVLGDEFRREVSPDRLPLVDQLFRCGWQMLGWLDVVTLFVWYGEVVERRR